MKSNISLNPILKAVCILITCFTIISCQKQINSLEDDGTLPGGGGGTTPSSSSYLPSTTGSTWTMQDSANPAMHSITAVTNEKKVVDGITFLRHEVLEGPMPAGGEMYYAQQKNDYYMLVETPISTSGQKLAILYLKDNVAAGTTWTKDAGSSGGIPARIKGKIVQKGFTHTWIGLTYSNIIHSVVDLEYNVMGIWTSMATYNIYSAKGIGIVKAHNSVEVMGQSVFANAAYLIDYEIK